MGKSSVEGNDDGSLLLPVFLPLAESALCRAATLPLILTNMKNKAGGKVKLI